MIMSLTEQFETRRATANSRTRASAVDTTRVARNRLGRTNAGASSFIERVSRLSGKGCHRCDHGNKDGGEEPHVFFLDMVRSEGNTYGQVLTSIVSKMVQVAWWKIDHCFLSLVM